MKVTLIVPRFPPAFDGVGDHAAHIADQLLAQGHAPAVITDGDHRTGRAYPITTIGARWDRPGLRRVFAELERSAPQAILIEYTPFNFGGRSFAPLAIARYARRRRIPIAAFVHEAFYRPGGSLPGGRLKLGLAGWRDRITLGAFDAIFATNEDRFKRIAAAVPAVVPRLSILPIGANIEPAPAMIWQPRGDSPARRAVTFGVVMPRRRIELLIEALAGADSNWRLDVVGRIWDDAYAANCRGLAVRLGVSDRVMLHGALDAADVTRIFLDSDVALHAAAEGVVSSSGALLAALAHGMPVIALATAADEPALCTVVDRVADAGALAGRFADYARPDGSVVARAAAARALYSESFGWPALAQAALARLTDGRRAAG